MSISPRLLFVAQLSALALGACSSAGVPPDEAASLHGGKADASGRAAYRDLEETLGGEDLDRWLDLRRLLVRDFDDVCGDTFCEGDYTNLQPLRLRCSVAAASGDFRSCIWLFAGSWEAVRPATGSIEVNLRSFRCKLPFTGAPAALLDALLGPGDEPPLRRALPGSGRSVYDALGDCFE